MSTTLERYALWTVWGQPHLRLSAACLWGVKTLCLCSDIRRGQYVQLRVCFFAGSSVLVLISTSQNLDVLAALERLTPVQPCRTIAWTPLRVGYTHIQKLFSQFLPERLKRGKAIKRREERGRRTDGDDGTSSSGNSLGVPCVSCLPPSLCGAQRSSTLSFLNMI